MRPSRALDLARLTPDAETSPRLPQLILIKPFQSRPGLGSTAAAAVSLGSLGIRTTSGFSFRTRTPLEESSLAQLLWWTWDCTSS